MKSKHLLRRICGGAILFIFTWLLFFAEAIGPGHGHLTPFVAAVYSTIAVPALALMMGIIVYGFYLLVEG